MYMGCQMMAILEKQAGSLIMMDSPPCIDDYMGSVQTCRKSKDVKYANRLHTQICSSGLEVHEVLGNHLIPLYVDCGSVFRAHQAFCKLGYPSERAWTSLILGFVESDALQDAFNLFESMQADEFIQPSGHTYLALLKACAKLECPEEGHYVHTEIIKGGYDTDIFVANALIDMHAKCGSLADAQSVFEMLPTRDIVSWNSLMTAFVDHEVGIDLFGLFKRMQADGIDPNERTFVCLLRACANEQAASKGQELHNGVSREGLDDNVYVSSALVDMYAKCGLLTEARDVFDELPVRDVVLWTALISGFLEHGLCNQAWECLEVMQREGVSPNSVTWISCLKACQMVGLIGEGQAIHAAIVKCGLDLNLCSNLVGFYADCGLLVEARQVFKKLPMQDAIAWTGLLTGYVDNGLGEEAISSLDEMEEGVTWNSFLLACITRACGSCNALERGLVNHAKTIEEGYEENVIVCNSLIQMYIDCSLLKEAEDVFNDLHDRDVVSWSALITGYIEHNLPDKALSCFNQMQLEGLSPDAITFVKIIRACGILQTLGTGQKIHTQLTIAGFEEDFYIGTSLIVMYAKCGCFDEAWKLVCLVQDVASWNALIAGYIEKEMNMEAVDCLLEMYSVGVFADNTTYACCLRACGSAGAIGEGQVMHAEVVKRGFDDCALVGNALVTFYSKCHLNEEASEVFNWLPVMDVVSWNGFITGYAEKGCAQDAVECLNEMRSQGVAPNIVTYVETLRACSRSNALSEGLQLHGELVKEGFDEDPYIRNSLVDMYAKCGSLTEARSAFDSTSSPGLVSWTALMSGYVDEGFDEEAVNLLETMQSQSVSPDAFMYACSLKACGRLREVEKVQHLHNEISKEGYEVDHYVGGALVDCYVKSGSLVVAQELFDEMVVKDAVSWSALTVGYLEYNCHDECLTGLEQLLLGEVELDAIAFVCGLKSCGNLGTIEKGLELHLLIAKEGFEDDAVVSTSLLSMYSKCGWFIESSEIFDGLLVHDVVAWNALMVGHMEHGHTEIVLKLSDQMQSEGVLPDVSTLIILLRTFSGMSAIERGLELHSFITKLGLEKDIYPGSSVIEMYAACGLLEAALHVHQSLLVRDTKCWNALISGYIKCDYCRETINFYKKMQQEGHSPDATSFTSILTGCKNTDSIDIAHSLHFEIVIEGFERDSAVAKSLVVAYARCGFFLEAQDLFDDSPVQDAYLWSEMVMCYAKEGQNETVLLMYDRMQEQGVLPNSVTFMSILGACGNMLALDRAKKIHVQVSKVIDLQASKVILGSAMIDMYGKCGSMVDALQEFHAMPKEDVTGWNTLITGYARNGESDLVFHTIQKMEAAGVNPNEVTLLIVLTVCSHAGLIEKGQVYFEAMVEQYNLLPAIKHQSTMIDLFGRTGQLSEAVVLVEDMQTEVDNVVWHSMLGACQKWGDSKIGSEAFDHAATSRENHAGSFVLMSNIYAEASA